MGFLRRRRSSSGGGMGFLSKRCSTGRSPPLRRQNSILETKTLCTRSSVRSASFCAPAGSELAFRFDAHFTWLHKLGSGSFADVWAVRHKGRADEKYAIKCLKHEFKSRAERAAYLQEIEVANTLPAHPNVLTYYRAWQDDGRLYVQMELCERGTLREQMVHTRFDMAEGEPALWRLGAQLGSGLAHVHAHGLLHCDVKPENVLLDARGVYKLGDLGQATAVASWAEGVHEGDARYLSRDLLECKPSGAADVFSMGLLLLELRSGLELPGHGDEWDRLRDGAAASVLAAADPAMRELVSSMMCGAPEARPSAERVAAVSLAKAPRATSATLLARRGSRLVQAAVRGVGALRA